MPDLDLGEVDVVEFLSMLGVFNITDDGVEVRYSCPYPAHGMGDRTPSAYMNMETTAFMCQSCGASGNAITFLADVKEVNRLTAKEWIAQKWAPNYANIENLYEYATQIYAKGEKALEPEPAFQPLSEDVIDESNPWVIASVNWATEAQREPRIGWVDYMLSRGFTPEILDRFGFVYDRVTDRPCITVRDVDGGLVGFKGRAWKGEDRKYMVAGDTPRTIEQYGVRYGFEPYDASRFLFGAHIAKPIDGWLILCEGEFNVVSMHQKGFTNVIGPSGSTLSDTQIRKIVSMCEGVIILFDTDSATMESYATAQAKILKAMRAFDPYIEVRVCGDHEGDPAEMSERDLITLVGTARSSTRFQAEAMLRTIS